jgi:hypothetical protein
MLRKSVGASSFAPLAAYTVFCAGRGGNLLSFAAIPGHHLQNVSRTSADALSAADAGIVNFDWMRHWIKAPNESLKICLLCELTDLTARWHRYSLHRELKVSLPQCLEALREKATKLHSYSRWEAYQSMFLLSTSVLRAELSRTDIFTTNLCKSID